MFLNPYLLWITIIVLSFIAYNCNKNNLKDLIKTKLLFIVSISIILGYLVTGLTEIFGYALIHNYEYVFMREFDNHFFYNILEIVIIAIMSLCYNGKIKKIINIFLIVIIVGLSLILWNRNQIAVNAKFESKLLAYNIEKTNLVYSYFGELPLIKNSYNKHRLIEGRIGMFVTDPFLFENYVYVPPDSISYKIFYKYLYNYDYVGFIFTDDKIAEKELEARLLLVDDKMESRQELKKNGIKFKKLKEDFADKNLTFQDIEKIEKKHGKSDILIKARAYIYFCNEQYDEALQLYEEYLKKHPNDIDALVKTSVLYEEQYNNESNEKIRKKIINLMEKNSLRLNNLDTNNMGLKFQYLKILYTYKKDYKKSLLYTIKMISQAKEYELPYLYYNQGIIYLKLNQNEKAEELFEKAKLSGLEIFDNINEEEKENLIPIPLSLSPVFGPNAYSFKRLFNN